MFGRHKVRNERSIRKSIDSYPDALSFSTPGGRLILANDRINQLVYVLTGHTLIEANETWRELTLGTLQPNCQRLDKPWLFQTKKCGEAEWNLFFRLPDKSIWQMQKRLLTDDLPYTVQITGTDITELYRKSEELYRNNERLTAMHERQKELLGQIMHISQQKELLSAKMRIHDELGQCLIATQKALAENILPEGRESLTAAWMEMLRALESMPSMQSRADESTERELLQVAGMIGCKIQLEGKRPAGHVSSMLMYAAIREALTNAVRHAGADELWVTIEEQEREYQIRISDNGHVRPEQIREGVGLSSLRRRMEQEGASLLIHCGEKGVVLEITIPKDRENHL